MHINKCPHCGKDGGLTFVDNKNPFLTEGKECVICCYCKTRTKYYRTEREAIEAWNEMAKVDYDSEGRTIVEDTKGYRTPEYIIKRKLMLWVHGIRIREV